MWRVNILGWQRLSIVLSTRISIVKEQLNILCDIVANDILRGIHRETPVDTAKMRNAFRIKKYNTINSISRFITLSKTEVPYAKEQEYRHKGRKGGVRFNPTRVLEPTGPKKEFIKKSLLSNKDKFYTGIVVILRGT